ncbi:hypothetical protein GJ496_010624 [Pomphorhynchus laevis]|nr:hypothetical protein GJ496_010624 [Pomphorhynchus laevis]
MYTNEYENLCSGCGQSITDDVVVKMMDLKWHNNCLHCGDCYCRLSDYGNAFLFHGKLLCKRDFSRRQFVCQACQNVIEERDPIIRTDQFTYHEKCFCCQYCGSHIIEGDRYFAYNGYLMCAAHVVQNNLPDNDANRKSMTQGSTSKRSRTIFSALQARILKRVFVKNQTPGSKEISNLSDITGLEKRIIQVWFQNMRAKLRRKGDRFRQNLLSEDKENMVLVNNERYKRKLYETCNDETLTPRKMRRTTETID